MSTPREDSTHTAHDQIGDDINANEIQPNQEFHYVDKRISIYGTREDLSEMVSRRGSMSYEVYPGIERETYDFTAERVHLHASNIIESTAHFIKGCLGAGVLTMHVGYMNAGLWTSVVASLILGILVYYTAMMLIKSAHKMYVRLRISRLTYPDLAEVAVATGPWKAFRRCSKAIRYFVECCLFIEMCVTCCFYKIMVANTLKKAIESVSSAARVRDLHIRIYIVIVTIPLILLCLIRKLKYLAPFSVVADVVVGLCVLTTIYYSVKESNNILERPAWKSYRGLFEFCGVFLYSIHGVSVILPIENNMKRPRYFFVVLQFGMGISVLLNMLAGFFGYWGWGEDCQSPITIHMPCEIVPAILQFLLALMLSVTFAVHFWVAFRVIWHYLGRRYMRNRAIWERSFRVIHVTIIAILAVSFPNLIRLMVFVGNFFVTFIAFIFPAMIESLVRWKEPRRGTVRWLLIKNTLLAIIGIIFCGGAFYSTFDVT